MSMALNKEAVWTATLLVTIIQLLLTARPAYADANCGGCLNGGNLLLPNNIFGVCRCRCQAGFKGPKCQFIRKRSELRLSDLLLNRGGRQADMEAVLASVKRSSGAVDEPVHLAQYERDLPQDVGSLLRFYQRQLQADPTTLDN